MLRCSDRRENDPRYQPSTNVAEDDEIDTTANIGPGAHWKIETTIGAGIKSGQAATIGDGREAGSRRLSIIDPVL